MKKVQFDDFAGVRIEKSVQQVFAFSMQNSKAELNKSFRILGADIYPTARADVFNIVGHHVGEARDTVDVIKNTRYLLNIKSPKFTASELQYNGHYFINKNAEALRDIAKLYPKK